MRKLSIPFFLLLTLLLLLTFSCKKDRMVDGMEEQEMNNGGVRLNSDIMRSGNFFGDVFSDIVLINCQDGPTTELMTNELKTLLELTEREDAFFIFNLHQQQTLRPESFETEIDFEAAKQANQQSVDNLAKVILYFKGQNKTVYVLGTGFGAYIVQELLVREGTEIADKYLLMAGRLDMPELVWESFSKGNTGGFINGATPFTGAPSTLTTSEKNNNKLMAGLAYKSYTSELAKYNDLTMVTYCFGLKDESFGRLSQNEQALLITRKANLLEMEGGHQETIEGLLDMGFEVAFESE